MTATATVEERVNGLAGYRIMECPWCKGYLKYGERYDVSKQKWKFDRWITPIRARYICGTCNKGVQYEL